MKNSELCDTNPLKIHRKSSEAIEGEETNMFAVWNFVAIANSFSLRAQSGHKKESLQLHLDWYFWKLILSATAEGTKIHITNWGFVNYCISFIMLHAHTISCPPPSRWSKNSYCFCQFLVCARDHNVYLYFGHTCTYLCICVRQCNADMCTKVIWKTCSMNSQFSDCSSVLLKGGTLISKETIIMNFKY